MVHTLYREFIENNPRHLNSHEDQRYNKAIERGFLELSKGQFWIYRKKKIESHYSHWQ